MWVARKGKRSLKNDTKVETFETQLRLSRWKTDGAMDRNRHVKKKGYLESKDDYNGGQLTEESCTVIGKISSTKL